MRASTVIWVIRRLGGRGLLGLALIVGLSGGIILTGFAAVRRTETAFERMRVETEAWDVLVNPDLGYDSRLDVDSVAALPMVAEVGRVDGVLLGPDRLEAVSDLDGGPLILATDGTVGYDFARYVMLSGRMPALDAADEILLTPEAAAAAGVETGDPYPAKLATFEDFGSLAESADVDQFAAGYNAPGFGTDVDLRVVGIGVPIDELVVDEAFVGGGGLVSPAFLEVHEDGGAGFFGLPVRLREGATTTELRAAVEDLVPDEPVAFQTADAIGEQVDRAVEPEVSAVRVFTIVAGLVALAIVGQAVSRRLQLDAVIDPALRALGLTRPQRVAIALGRMALVGVIGAVLALGIAVLASPIAPVGLIRDAEPDPGIRLDPLVLLVGFFGVVLATVAVSIWPAVRVARARARGRTRAGLVSSTLVGWGVRPPAVLGARFALEPGPSAVPTRSTLVGAATSVVLVAATVTFAASLDHFVDTPELYGSTWTDVISVESITEEDADFVNLADQFVDDERIEAFSKVVPGQVSLDDHSVPAFALGDSARPLHPTVVEGRVLSADDEVVLGTGTMEDLGVDVGDRVTVTGADGAEASLEVVGRAVLPVVAAYPGSDKTTLGLGAVLTEDGLAAWSPEFSPEGVATRFVDGVDADDVVADLDIQPYEFIDVNPEGQPSDVSSLERVRSTPLLLAAVVTALIALTVAHALGAAVRARRRELAVVRTFGFSRSQVLGAVAIQASLIAVVAILVGVPLGIAAGRLAWTWVVDGLGAIVSLVSPTFALAVVALAVLAVANLVALVPGLRAARAHPATILRTE